MRWSSGPRVLLAHGDAAVRRGLGRALDEQGLEVVGEAADAAQAITMVGRRRPDVALVSAGLPGTGRAGVLALLEADVRVRVLVLAGAAEREDAMRAVAAGALEVLPDPGNSRPYDLRAWSALLAQAARLMSDVPVVSRRPPPRREPGGDQPRQPVIVVGMVASTGGPSALAEVLARLPGDLSLPIIVVQHIAPGFSEDLARWLEGRTELRVALARDGAAARPGHVYLAPEGCDVVSHGLVVRTPPQRGRCNPSGDRLLRSLARSHRERACGFVLTGMGEDGAEGLLSIRTAGGVTAVQDPESCVIRGMPDAALRMGAATERLGPIEIAARVRAFGCPPRREAAVSLGTASEGGPSCGS